MWLLDTSRAELHHFHSPKDVTGGYAILSHTWGEHEQTFQDLQAIQKRCEANGTNPRDVVCDKIRECCKKAESEGYKWVWNDACCIDKTSSTELSEAINSMFGWYANSEVCYAFLADVPSGTDLAALKSAFRSSRWHTRGWTLQELIAPSVVVFLSSDWQPLGTRVALASLLSEITLIPETYLTHKEHHSKAGVAERMTWAAKRRTTRVEDEAYCLMGIFNVNIPTIYGEGPRAFRRLQLEIMRTSRDTSLFVWGAMARRDELFNPLPYAVFIKIDMTSFGVYLLAPSPRDFSWRIGEGTRFTPACLTPRQPYLPSQWAKVAVDDKDPEEQRTKGSFGSVELPRFELTNYGVRCHFPLIEIPDGPTIAVLLCETNWGHIGLLLYRSDEVLQDHNLPQYNTGYFAMRGEDHFWFRRLISLGDDLYNLQYKGQPVQAQWKDIYVADGPPAHQDRLYGPDVSFINCLAHTPFRIPHWLLSRLHAMHFGLKISCVYDIDGARVFNLFFEDNDVTAQGFDLFLGERCTKQPGDPCHWAKVSPWGEAYSHLMDDDTNHDCAMDHVADWPGWSKEVGDGAKMLRISFTRCRREPETTLVLHLELLGTEWTRLLADAHVSFPTREELGWSDPCLRPESASITSIAAPVETRTGSLARLLPSSAPPSLTAQPPLSRRALPASANNARSDANALSPPSGPVPRPLISGEAAADKALRHRENLRLLDYFCAIDTDRSGNITVSELHNVLCNEDWTPFDLNTVELLMSVFDTNRNGTLEFYEFATLWKCIEDWENVFRQFDRDNAGRIDDGELHSALQQLGYNLSPRILRLVQAKYGSSPRGSPGMAPSEGVTFDRFIRACLVIKQISETSQKLDTDRDDGCVQISYEQIMETVLLLL